MVFRDCTRFLNPFSIATIVLLIGSTSAAFGQMMMGGDRGDRPMDGPRGGSMHEREIGEGVGLGIGLGIEIGKAISKQGTEDNARKKAGDGSATVTKSPDTKKPKRAAKKGDDDAPVPVHPPKAPDQPPVTAGTPATGSSDNPKPDSSKPDNPKTDSPPTTQTTSRPDPSPPPQDPKDLPKPPDDPMDIAWECDEPICVGGLTRKQVAGMLHDGCVRTEKVLSFLDLPGSIEDNLNKASGPARVYLDFFSGKDGATNRETLKGWLIKIKDGCKQPVTLICEKCDAKTLKIGYSYTHGGSGIGGALNGIFYARKIHLCVPQWCNAKGQTPRGQAGSLLHELSHLVGTDDMTGKAGEQVEFTAQVLTEKLIPTLSDAYDKLAPSSPGTSSASAAPPK